MTPTQIAGGVALLTALALIINYHAAIRACFTAATGGVRHLRFGRITDNPRAYMDWYWRERWVPVGTAARQGTAIANTQHDRALRAQAAAEGAFPAGVPTGAARIGLMIAFGCWVVVAAANGALDWSLNNALARNPVLATLLTAFTVTAPFGLAYLTQTAFGKRASWRADHFRAVLIGLALLYIVLLTFVGFLGVTRAERTYDSNMAKVESAYAQAVTQASSEYDPQIQTAQLVQTQGEAEGADAATQTFNAQQIESLRAQKATALTAAQSEHDENLRLLQQAKSSDQAKWVAYAVGAVAFEAGFSFAVKNGVLLLQVLLARRRERQAADKVTRAEQAEERLGARMIARLARILARAGVEPEEFDRFLADHGMAPRAGERAAEPAALPAGDAPAAAVDEGVVIDGEAPETAPDAAPEAEGEAAAAGPDDETPADGPTPGFDEA